MKITKKKKSFVVKDSIPIANNPDILNWLVGYQLKAFETNTKNLSRNLFDELTKAYGEQTKRFMGEHLTSIWVLCYGNLMFNVFTAMGKGTSIEICDHSFEEINQGKNQKEIVDFLNELGEAVNE